MLCPQIRLPPFPVAQWHPCSLFLAAFRTNMVSPKSFPLFLPGSLDTGPSDAMPLPCDLLQRPRMWRPCLASLRIPARPGRGKRMIRMPGDSAAFHRRFQPGNTVGSLVARQPCTLSARWCFFRQKASNPFGIPPKASWSFVTLFASGFASLALEGGTLLSLLVDAGTGGSCGHVNKHVQVSFWLPRKPSRTGPLGKYMYIYMYIYIYYVYIYIYMVPCSVLLPPPPPPPYGMGPPGPPAPLARDPEPPGSVTYAPTPTPTP